jgi:hypothetical protein
MRNLFPKHFCYNKYDYGSADAPAQKQVNQGITSGSQKELSDCNHSERASCPNGIMSGCCVKEHSCPAPIADVRVHPQLEAASLRVRTVETVFGENSPKAISRSNLAKADVKFFKGCLERKEASIGDLTLSISRTSLRRDVKVGPA